MPHEEQIRELINALIKDRVVHEQCYINITPWWGHGPYATMIDPVTGEPSLPTSKTLVGKLRWLLRWIAAELKPTNQAEADKKLLAQRLGTTASEGGGKASNYIIIVRSEIAGDETPYYLDKTTASSLAKELVNAISSSYNRSMAMKLKVLLREVLINIPECFGFAKLINPNSAKGEVISMCGRLTEISAGNIWDAYERGFSRSRASHIDYFKLFTIPRVKYVIDGKALSDKTIEDKCKLFPHKKIRHITRRELEKCLNNLLVIIAQGLPLRPGTVRLCVKILRRAGKAPDPDFEDALKKAVPVVLKYIGIGYASTRGFGRFIPEDNEFNSTRVKEELKSLCLAVAKLLKDGDIELERACKEIFGDDDSVDDSTKSEDKIMTISVYSEVKHPCPAPQRAWPSISRDIAAGRTAGLSRVNTWKCLTLVEKSDRRISVSNDVLGVLSAIGYSTLKAVWKMVRGELRRVGFSYHTWPLGLPRGVKRGDEVTGYYLTQASNIPYVGGLSEYRIERGGRFEEVRRVSPIVLTPILLDTVTKRYGVAVLDLMPWKGIASGVRDIQTILDGVSKEIDHRNEIFKLAIIGYHRGYNRERGTATIQGVKEVAIKDHRTIDEIINHFTGRPGRQPISPNDYGYTSPHGREKAEGDSIKILEDISSAAIEWIKRLLT